MEAPCCTKIIKYLPHPTLNFLETLQGKGCNLFAMSLMRRWRMNETKTEWNLLLAFFWSILKMKFFGRINDGKWNHPTPGQCYLFHFFAGKRQSWWMHWNGGLNPYSFNVLKFSNHFSKWVIFGYGEICVQYWYIIHLSVFWWCKTSIELAR